MKKNKTSKGFALLLMGIIFAAPGDTFAWYIGVIIGLIGLVFVFLSKNED